MCNVCRIGVVTITDEWHALARKGVSPKESPPVGARTVLTRPYTPYWLRESSPTVRLAPACVEEGDPLSEAP